MFCLVLYIFNVFLINVANKFETDTEFSKIFSFSWEDIYPRGIICSFMQA